MTTFREKLPKVGSIYIVAPGGESAPTATFAVAEVDKETGCIYLNPADPMDVTMRVLEHPCGERRGETMVAPLFHWDKSRNQFAVNVEWDAWQLAEPVDLYTPSEGLQRAFQRYKELIK